MSLSLTTTTRRVNLPYDIINVIFDFLSQITDNGETGYYCEVNKLGKIRLMIRPSFTGIFDITRFKQSVSARYVQLTVRQWVPEGEPPEEYTVNALEQPHRIHDQATIDENYCNGFISDNRCYTYSDPQTEMQMIAYVESRNHYLDGNIAFRQGCVYSETGESYVLSGFGTDLDGNTTIVVNPYSMIWDIEGEDHWADDLEAAEALLELNIGEDEEIDFDDLQPLQMYM